MDKYILKNLTTQQIRFIIASLYNSSIKGGEARNFIVLVEDIEQQLFKIENPPPSKY